MCILIDLPELSEMVNHKFLESNDFSVQAHAVDKFYNPLRGDLGKNLMFPKLTYLLLKRPLEAILTLKMTQSTRPAILFLWIRISILIMISFSRLRLFAHGSTHCKSQVYGLEELPCTDLMT